MTTKQVYYYCKKDTLKKIEEDLSIFDLIEFQFERLLIRRQIRHSEKTLQWIDKLIKESIDFLERCKKS